jgi:predicted MFS family arabinose efflux permease
MNATRQEPTSTDRTAWITLATLAAAYGVHALDRSIFTLLLEPIKRELALSDAQLGLLTGLAFAIFYAALGLPMARLADRWNRKHLIIISILIFSAATVASGLAGGFISLMLARVVVGIGEAGPTPASVSILSDRFPPARRPLAMSLFIAGALCGTTAGLLAIGVFGANVSWRGVFWAAGIGGLVVALLVFAFVREPRRRATEAVSEDFGAAMVGLLRIPSFRWISVGSGLFAALIVSVQGWVPAFLTRSHGFDRNHIVLFLALAWGVGGVVGVTVLGALTNWIRKRGGPAVLIFVALLIAVTVVVLAIALSTPSTPVCIAALVLAFFLMPASQGPTFALVQDLTPPQRRATATALLQLISNGIGLGLGPLATGALSDALRPRLDSASLSAALLCVVVVAGGAGATAMLLASRRIVRDLAQTDAGARAPALEPAAS